MFHSIRNRINRSLSGLGIRKEICPYCFEPFSMLDTPFRCVSPFARCAPEVDEVLAKFWGRKAPESKVLRAEGKFRVSVRCAGCNQESHKRLCPHCHIELPTTTGQFENMIFAVIGAKDAGKSHYIAVLIEQFKNFIGPSLGLLLEPLNDMTLKRYRASFYEPVYKTRKVIRNTESGRTDNADVRMPMIFTMAFTGKNFMGAASIKNIVTLVFFDTAGEDLNDADTMSTINKYIYRANGVILLIDPLQLSHVRNGLTSGVGLPSQNAETEDIITRTTNLIQQGRNLRQNEMISTPFAVAFSKIDAVDSLLDPQMQLRSKSNHFGGFDIQDFQAVSGEMQAQLANWDSANIVQQVTTRYKTFGFFGLTALGCNPHATGGNIMSVLPRRVEDPFLWLLHCNGLLSARKK